MACHSLGLPKVSMSKLRSSTGQPTSRCVYPQISAEGGEAGGRDEDRAGLRRRERADRAHAGPAGRHDVRWAHTNNTT